MIEVACRRRRASKLGNWHLKVTLYAEVPAHRSIPTPINRERYELNNSAYIFSSPSRVTVRCFLLLLSPLRAAGKLCRLRA